MLTRRRSKDNHHRETRHIYFGDVHVGSIGERVGIPVGVDRWGWLCGLYPGFDPGQHRHGTAPTFAEARAAFEADWHALVPEGAFDENRYSSAFTAWKHRMWDCGCRMPTQTRDGRTTCFCGIEISNVSINAHIRERHMENACHR
jgi:hypothetical protein